MQTNGHLDAFPLLLSNIHLLAIATFGGFVLFGLKCAEHFLRAEQDKFAVPRYIVFFIALLIGLPILGIGVTSIYILNGDVLSPILAFQVGLTSPAIVQSLIIAAANSLAKSTAPVVQQGQ